MTNSPSTPSTKGDPQGPSIRVQSGTPSSTGPAAAAATAGAPGEPSPEAADLLSAGAAASSVRSTAVATAAGSVPQHPSPESSSQSSSFEAGTLSRSGTTTEHSLAHMGGGCLPPSSAAASPRHGAKRPRSEADADSFFEDLRGIQGGEGDGAEPLDAQNKAKRVKRTSGTGGDDDGDEDDDKDKDKDSSNERREGTDAQGPPDSDDGDAAGSL